MGDAAGIGSPQLGAAAAQIEAQKVQVQDSLPVGVGGGAGRGGTALVATQLKAGGDSAQGPGYEPNTFLESSPRTSSCMRSSSPPTGSPAMKTSGNSCALAWVSAQLRLASSSVTSLIV